MCSWSVIPGKTAEWIFLMGTFWSGVWQMTVLSTVITSSSAGVIKRASEPTCLNHQ